jgi:hypothetical protein
LAVEAGSWSRGFASEQGFQPPKKLQSKLVENPELVFRDFETALWNMRDKSLSAKAFKNNI